jgi:hypothetical protein
MATLKQVITDPLSQRQKIVGLLIDLMSFTVHEKEMVIKCPSGCEDFFVLLARLSRTDRPGGLNFESSRFIFQA